MLEQRAEIYLPAVARSADDLRNRHQMLTPVRERGFKTGLMLVLRGPQDLEEEAIRKQLDNLDPFLNLSRDEKPSVFVMHPNKPLTGPQKFNFLTNQEWSREYVEKSIDFASRIPAELTPVTGQMVSFHLNTLLTPEEFKQGCIQYLGYGAFGNSEYLNPFLSTIDFAPYGKSVLVAIENLANYAKKGRIKIGIETTPITEFGDMEKNEATLLEDGKTYWADLGNPWPLLPWRQEIQEIRNIGAGVVVDICHSFIAMRTVQEVAWLIKADLSSEALKTYMIDSSDLDHVQSLGNFSDEILRITEDGGAWHVNDALGLYRTPELYGKQTYFKEGIPLFEGDIPTRHLERLIREGLRKPIKFVLEINETDFANSPNTKRSLQMALEIADSTSRSQ